MGCNSSKVAENTVSSTDIPPFLDTLRMKLHSFGENYDIKEVYHSIVDVIENDLRDRFLNNLISKITFSRKSYVVKESELPSDVKLYLDDNTRKLCTTKDGIDCYQLLSNVILSSSFMPYPCDDVEKRFICRQFPNIKAYKEFVYELSTKVMDHNGLCYRNIDYSVNDASIVVSSVEQLIIGSIPLLLEKDPLAGKWKGFCLEYSKNPRLEVVLPPLRRTEYATEVTPHVNESSAPEMGVEKGDEKIEEVKAEEVKIDEEKVEEKVEEEKVDEEKVDEVKAEEEKAEEGKIDEKADEEKIDEEKIEEKIDEEKVDEEKIEEKVDEEKIDEVKIEEVNADEEKIEEKVDEEKVDEEKTEEKADEEKVDEEKVEEKIEEKIDEVKIEEKADEEKADEEKVEEKAEEEKADEEKIDEEKIDEEKVDEVKTEERIDEVKTEEKVDEEKIDEEKTDEVKAEEEKADEVKTEEKADKEKIEEKADKEKISSENSQKTGDVCKQVDVKPGDITLAVESVNETK